MALGRLPPWVTGVNTLSELSSGESAGLGYARIEQESRNESARLGMEAQRMQQGAALQQAQLEQQAQQHQMEFQARQKLAEQNQLRQQQRLNIENAYKTAALGIAKGRLEETQQAAADKARTAALTFQREQAFARDVASGIPVMQAYQRNPVSPSLFNSVSKTQEGNKPIHVGDAIVERQPDGTFRESYRSPRSNKPIKVGKTLLEVGEDGKVKVLYGGETEKPSILGAASEEAPPSPGLWSRIKNVVSPSTPTPPKETPANKDKVVRAHALGIAHPDWTKEQIIDAVNKEMQ